MRRYSKMLEEMWFRWQHCRKPAEELFGATVVELREIDANNEESDDDDDDEIDFNLVAKKVLNHSIDEFKVY